MVVVILVDGIVGVVMTSVDTASRDDWLLVFFNTIYWCFSTPSTGVFQHQFWRDIAWDLPVVPVVSTPLTDRAEVGSQHQAQNQILICKDNRTSLYDQYIGIGDIKSFVSRFEQSTRLRAEVVMRSPSECSRSGRRRSAPPSSIMYPFLSIMYDWFPVLMKLFRTMDTSDSVRLRCGCRIEYDSSRYGTICNKCIWLDL